MDRVTPPHTAASRVTDENGHTFEEEEEEGQMARGLKPLEKRSSECLLRISSSEQLPGSLREKRWWESSRGRGRWKETSFSI